MKKLIILIALVSIFMYSCDNEEIIKPEPVQLQKDTITSIKTDLKFKIAPTATDQFQISVLNEEEKSMILFLNTGNQQLLKSELTEDPNMQGNLIGTIRYSFASDDLYSIAIKSSWENTDTVFQEIFTIPLYNHKYYSRLSYELLASINQRLDFDISPSRDVIFYLDYNNMHPILKRLSLADKKLDILDDEFSSLLIRSVSDNQLIIFPKEYNNRFLGVDSCAILTYDVDTRNTSFLGWGSSDYGRFSRVINNSIMVSNPVYTNSISLLDLSDNSAREFQADVRYLRQYNFDHIYMGNRIFDFSDFRFVNKLPSLKENSSIIYHDENSQYFITEEYFHEPFPSLSSYSRMVIYKDNDIVFEQPFEKGKFLNFPSIVNLDDNKLMFYQYHDYDSKLRFDGYYQLDLDTKEIVPIHYKSDSYIRFDFFNSNDKQSFISVGPYDIYKISLD
jgi:hypothetical protein